MYFTTKGALIADFYTNCIKSFKFQQKKIVTNLNRDRYLSRYMNSFLFLIDDVEETFEHPQKAIYLYDSFI